jgi:hypothetical protein
MVTIFKTILRLEGLGQLKNSVIPPISLCVYPLSLLGNGSVNVPAVANTRAVRVVAKESKRLILARTY